VVCVIQLCGEYVAYYPHKNKNIIFAREIGGFSYPLIRNVSILLSFSDTLFKFGTMKMLNDREIEEWANAYSRKLLNRLSREIFKPREWIDQSKIKIFSAGLKIGAKWAINKYSDGE